MVRVESADNMKRCKSLTGLLNARPTGLKTGMISILAVFIDNVLHEGQEEENAK